MSWQACLDTFVRPTERLLLQVPRALVVSAVAAALDTSLLFVFVNTCHMPALLAATISYLLGGVVQYVACSVWVFPASPSSAMIGFTVFTVLSLVGLGITALVIWALYEQLRWHLLLAKVVALGCAFVWNFGSRRTLLFRNQAG